MNDDEPVALLKRLIAIPSVNPMGGPVDKSICLESRMANFVANFFRQLNFDTETIEVAPGRPNVLVFIPGSSKDLVLVDVHMDTVPVDGMTIDPFQAFDSAGRVWGRGAVDVKGSMACVLAAITQIHARNRSLRSDTLLSFTCDEEQGESGVHHLTECLTGRRNESALISGLKRLPVHAIVMEPTNLDVVVAHRGTVRWKIETQGVSAHSSEPEQGSNAIYKMARIVSVLEDIASHLANGPPKHPLLGTPTLSVGRIQGGTSVNVVPDKCEIEIDRRLLPGESAAKVLQDVKRYLTEHAHDDFVMHPPWMNAPPLPDSSNRQLATQLLKSIGNIVPDKTPIGVPFGTHAARFHAAGIPAVVFGPGSIEQAHTADEWIAVDQLNLATQILTDFLAGGD